MKTSTPAVLPTFIYALSLSSTVLGAACKVKSKDLGYGGGHQYVTSEDAKPTGAPDWYDHDGEEYGDSWSSKGWNNPDYDHSSASSSSIVSTSMPWGYSGRPSWSAPAGHHSSWPAGQQSRSRSLVWPPHSHDHDFSTSATAPASSAKVSSVSISSSSPTRSLSSHREPSSGVSAPLTSSVMSTATGSTLSTSHLSVVPSSSISSSRSVSPSSVSSSRTSTISSASASSASSSSSVSSSTTSSAPVSSTTCNGKTYIYNELAAWGILAGDARESTGDTLGGIGSAIAIDRSSWRKEGGSYKFTLYALPDRGWNTEGTLNYQSRVQKFHMTFTPMENATVADPSEPNLIFDYTETILLTGPDGVPTTGLNADPHDFYTIAGFPDMPVATYTGNGFGQAGSGGRRISVDAEGLFLGHDGTFWISDEYGPNIYQFSPEGRMLKAIQPPDAILPLRNGSISYTTDDVFIYDQDFTIEPVDNPSGRANNKGFEGLTVDPTGTFAFALLQAAANQEGGLKKTDRRYSRLVKYNIVGTPVLVGEWVVALPLYTDDEGKSVVAEQSEIHYISDTQFMVLARDKDHGHGQDGSTSLYRHVDIFDISAATNIAGTYDAFNASIASTKGVLKTGITAATLCPFLDFNVNTQLNRFGAHNGGAQDAGLLNEKWESLALMPAEKPDEYYLFSFADNDFITQNGFMNFGQFPFADGTGFNLDNQALVFKVTLPSGSSPLVS